MRKEINPKIAIVGYGKMGKEIESIAKEMNIIITDIFDIDSPIDITKKYSFDVAIDFSYPESVLKNVKAMCKMKKNIVLGTTGWQKDFNQIKELVDKSQIGLIYASNFSIGMQIFFKSVQQISNLLDKIDGYDIMLFEAHHKRKKDCPSGTALKLAEIILQNYSKKNDFSFSPTQENINSNILQISSLRGGEIIGIHSVIIDSLQDSIELIHSAKNRKGFAIGAILSCKWIYRKKGFYEINDMLNTIWKK